MYRVIIDKTLAPMPYNVVFQTAADGDKIIASESVRVYPHVSEVIDAVEEFLCSGAVTP